VAVQNNFLSLSPLIPLSVKILNEKRECRPKTGNTPSRNVPGFPQEKVKNVATITVHSLFLFLPAIKTEWRRAGQAAYIFIVFLLGSIDVLTMAEPIMYVRLVDINPFYKRVIQRVLSQTLIVKESYTSEKR
jgi:hypothetical protein